MRRTPDIGRAGNNRPLTEQARMRLAAERRTMYNERTVARIGLRASVEPRPRWRSAEQSGVLELASLTLYVHQRSGRSAGKTDLSYISPTGAAPKLQCGTPLVDAQDIAAGFVRVIDWHSTLTHRVSRQLELAGCSRVCSFLQSPISHRSVAHLALQKPLSNHTKAHPIH